MKMGTNYYWARNNCNHCQRHDRVHIGKHSGGWMFSFRGHTDIVPNIRSWAEWKRELEHNDHPAPIINEYGDRLTFAEFAEIVESTRTAKLNHFDYCQERYPEYVQRARDGVEWKDPEGFSFSTSDFS